MSNAIGFIETKGLVSALKQANSYAKVFRRKVNRIL